MTPRNGKRNGWRYNNSSLKINIKNNEFIKNVRKKLMEEKLRKNFEK
ncbi:hypothetical protein LCGC14_1628820 [marine sediment metagenome]|uniref:Uncharacterized protein n=1 Tax=marine sediment metagenome TaxID=412755 RepID=A0A0F9IQC9_9ZZZZ